MRNKWVDLSSYFGPDRRQRGGRFFNRRGRDIAVDPPALAAILRRARVQMMGLSTEHDCRHALQMLTAAIAEAERRQLPRCVNALKRAEQVLNEQGAQGADEADALIAEANEHVADAVIRPR